MITGPSEEEQIQMVVKNLLPIFRKHLFAQYFPNFKALIIDGTQVEDAINNGMLKNEEGFVFEKAATHTTNEEAINVVVPQTSSTVNSRPRRKFNELHMPMSQLFEKLNLKGILADLNLDLFQAHCLKVTSHMSSANIIKNLAIRQTNVSICNMPFKIWLINKSSLRLHQLVILTLFDFISQFFLDWLFGLLFI